MSDAGDLATRRFLNLLNRLRKLGLGQPPFDQVQVTPSQLVLLDWIAESSGCSVHEIAAGLGLTPPTVSVGVRRLERVGLLERRPDPRDRRAVRLSLTVAGETLRQRAQGFRQRKARRLLAGLTPQEQETLLDLLERAIRSAEVETLSGFQG